MACTTLSIHLTRAPGPNKLPSLTEIYSKLLFFYDLGRSLYWSIIGKPDTTLGTLNGGEFTTENGLKKSKRTRGAKEEKHYYRDQLQQKPCQPRAGGANVRWCLGSPGSPL